MPRSCTSAGGRIYRQEADDLEHRQEADISGSGSFEIEIEDADAAALPDTAAVGIELQGSPTGETVLFDWRQRAGEPGGG